MPNTPVWGNNTDTQHSDQDLVSLGNEVIQVVDINDDERTALSAANSDPAGLALEIEGKSELEIDANVAAVLERDKSVAPTG